MLRTVLAALLLIAAPAALAQAPANDPALAAAAGTLVEESGAPAAALMRWQSGELRIGVAGVRANGEDVPVEPGDLWHMGSNTKAMTATLVARLVEAGVIGWDDTIAQHLGSAVETIDPAYRELTFRHLLSHRAGLAPNIGVAGLVRFQMEGEDGRPMPEQRLDYAAHVLDDAPSATPEADFLYSNAGYVVAGAMLEQATGESWETLLTREVFEPLGMASAGFGAPGSASSIDQPRGHRSGLFGGSNPVPPGPRGDNPPVMGPAGTVHVSLPDLARFLEAHLAGARGEGGDYLTAQSWDILHTPPFGGDYAMGWGVGGDRLQHAGSNTMWLVQMVIDTEDGLVRAAGVNDGRIDRVRPPMDAALAAMAGE